MPTTTTTITVVWDDGSTSTYTTTGAVSVSADGKKITFTGRNSTDTEDWDYTLFTERMQSWKKKSVTT